MVGHTYGGPPQDWTTESGYDNGQMMLNTNTCLMFDIDLQINGGLYIAVPNPMAAMNVLFHTKAPNVRTGYS